MFAEWLELDGADAELAFVTPSGSLTWSDFVEQIRTNEKAFADLSNQRVGLQLAPTTECLARLFSLINSGSHLFLIAADAQPDAMSEWATEFGLRSVFDPAGNQLEVSGPGKSATESAITILTSGTTGKPKAVEHSLDSLVRPVRKHDAIRGTRWLLTFRPHLYAGLQVIMQCLFNHGTLVMPASGSDATQVAQLAAGASVEFVSATPSYWRWLLTLAGEDLAGMPLKQITLGGEAVDQATLDALRQKFSDARLVHIYATTELGRCFSVTDGMAGFPKRFLGELSPDGVEMKIEAGELVVRSANAMAGYDGTENVSPQQDWFCTGDMVEVVGDRVLFVGRKTDMINVGGNKVYPIEVETLIRSIPGVADARVYGEASSMVGELVKCDVVVMEGFVADDVEKSIREKTLAELTNYQRPRFISIVKEIPRTAAGKISRD